MSEIEHYMAKVSALSAERDALSDALARAAQQREKATRLCRKHGYVFHRAPSSAIQRLPELSDGEQWEHLAFALYTMLAEIEQDASTVLDAMTWTQRRSSARWAASGKQWHGLSGVEGEDIQWLCATSLTLLARVETLESILRGILDADERGQGVGYAAAMERAREAVKGDADAE